MTTICVVTERIWKWSVRREMGKFSLGAAESPEIGKGGWPGTAELAAAQPTVHVNLNVVCRDAYKSPPSLYRL